VVGTAMFFGRRLRRISTGVQDKVADATALAEEAFSQIRTVQSFVQEPAERRRYGAKVGAIVDAALHRAQVRGIFIGSITFATFTSMVVILWQGGVLVLNGQLTAGSLVSFLLYTLFIAGAVGALASFFSNYQESIGSAERVFEILERPIPISDPPQPDTLQPPVRGAIRYESIWFRYHEDAESPWALSDLSLDLRPGEIVFCSTGMTFERCAWRTSAAPSASSLRNRRSSAGPSARTSPTHARTPLSPRSKRPRAPRTPTNSSSACRRAIGPSWENGG